MLNHIYSKYSRYLHNPKGFYFLFLIEKTYLPVPQAVPPASEVTSALAPWKPDAEPREAYLWAKDGARRRIE